MSGRDRRNGEYGVITISINSVDFGENPVGTKFSIYGLEINVKKKLPTYRSIVWNRLVLCSVRLANLRIFQLYTTLEVAGTVYITEMS
ncbi:hypothetical protein EYC80_000088 [Monilinia laxa]|uniref:Uncharacterized protein n=1 Tax=Monilinia laxa TaxID=61186 RepID=A0A5N6K9P1_MONLA|nr:hypothetical protein EYC80_000088 [Monilinia laxa]